MAPFGVSSELADQFLMTADDDLERVRSEATAATLCGLSPADQQGRDNRRHHRNRSGDRDLSSRHGSTGFESLRSRVDLGQWDADCARQMLLDEVLSRQDIDKLSTLGEQLLDL